MKGKAMEKGSVGARSLQYRTLLIALTAYRDMKPYGKMKLSWNGEAPLSGLDDELRTVMGAVVSYAGAYNAAITESREELMKRNPDIVHKFEDDYLDVQAQKSGQDSMGDGDIQDDVSLAINGFGDEDGEVQERTRPRFRQLVSSSSMLLFSRLRKAMSVLSDIDIQDGTDFVLNPLKAAGSEHTAAELDAVSRAFASFYDTLPDIQDIIPDSSARDVRRAISLIQERISSVSRDNPYTHVRTAAEYLLGMEAIPVLDGENTRLSQDRLSLDRPSGIDYLLNGKDEGKNAPAVIAAALSDPKAQDIPPEVCLKTLYLISTALSAVMPDEEIMRRMDEMRGILEDIGYKEGVDGLEAVPDKPISPSAGEMIAENLALSETMPGFMRAMGKEAAVWENIYPSLLALTSPEKYIGATILEIDKAIEKAAKSGKNVEQEISPVKDFSDIDMKKNGETRLEKLGLEDTPNPEASKLQMAGNLYHRRVQYLQACRLSKALYSDDMPLSLFSEKDDREKLREEIADKTVFSLMRYAMKPGRLPEYDGIAGFFSLDAKESAAALRNAADNGMKKVRRSPGRELTELAASAFGLSFDRETLSLRLRDVMKPGALLDKNDELPMMAVKLLEAVNSVDSSDIEKTLRKERDSLTDAFISSHSEEIAALDTAFRRHDFIEGVLRSGERRKGAEEFAEKNGSKDLSSLLSAFDKEVMDPYRRHFIASYKKLSERITKESCLPKRFADIEAKNRITDREFVVSRDRFFIASAFPYFRSSPESVDELMLIADKAKDIHSLIKTENNLRAKAGREGLTAEESKALTAEAADATMAREAAEKELSAIIRTDMESNSSISAAFSSVVISSTDNAVERTLSAFGSSIEKEKDSLKAAIRKTLDSLPDSSLRAFRLGERDVRMDISPRMLLDAVLLPYRDVLEDGVKHLSGNRDDFASIPLPLSVESKKRIYDSAWESLETEFPGYSKASAMTLSVFPEKAEKAFSKALDDEKERLSVTAPMDIINSFVTEHDRFVIPSDGKDIIPDIDRRIAEAEKAVDEERKYIEGVIAKLDTPQFEAAIRSAYKRSAGAVAEAAVSYAASRNGNVLTPEGFEEEFGAMLREGDERAARERIEDRFMRKTGSERSAAFSDAFAKAAENTPDAYEFLLDILDWDGLGESLARGRMPEIDVTGKEPDARSYAEHIASSAAMYREEYGRRSDELWDEFAVSAGIRGGLFSEALEDSLRNRYGEEYFRNTVDESIGVLYRSMLDAAGKDGDPWKLTLLAEEARKGYGEQTAELMLDSAKDDVSFVSWAEENIRGYASYGMYQTKAESTYRDSIRELRDELSEKAAGEAVPEYMTGMESAKKIAGIAITGTPLRDSAVAAAYTELIDAAFTVLSDAFEKEKKAYIEANIPEETEKAWEKRDRNIRQYYRMLLSKEERGEEVVSRAERVDAAASAFDSVEKRKEKTEATAYRKDGYTLENGEYITERTVYSEPFMEAMKKAEKAHPDEFRLLSAAVSEDSLREALRTGRMPFISVRGSEKEATDLYAGLEREAKRMAERTSGEVAALWTGFSEKNGPFDGLMHSELFAALREGKGRVAFYDECERKCWDEYQSEMAGLENPEDRIGFAAWAEKNIPGYAVFSSLDEKAAEYREKAELALENAALDAAHGAMPGWLRDISAASDLSRKIIDGGTPDDHDRSILLEAVLREAFDGVRNTFTAERRAYIEKESGEKEIDGNKLASSLTGQRLSEMRKYLTKNIAEAVASGSIPEPFTDFSSEKKRLSISMEEWDKALSETFEKGAECALRKAELASDAAVRFLSDAGVTLSSGAEHTVRSIARNAYAEEAARRKIDAAYSELEITEAANRRDLRYYEKTGNGREGEESIIYRSIAPMVRTSALRSYGERLFGEETAADLRNIAMYIRSLPSSGDVDTAKKKEDARAAFSAIVERTVTRRTDELRNAEERIAGTPMQDPEKMYRFSVQYGLAETLSDLKRDLIAVAEGRKEGSVPAIQDEIRDTLGRILLNNPDERDAEVYADKILSTDKRDFGDAEKGIRRLSVMGDYTDDGRGVKGFAERAKDILPYDRAEDLSRDWISEKRLMKPDRDAIREAEETRKEASAFLSIMKEPGAAEAMLALFGTGSDALMKSVPELTLMADGKIIDKTALDKLRSAVVMEDDSREKLVTEAKELWAAGKAFSSATNLLSASRSTIDAYGNTIDVRGLGEKVLIRTDDALSRFYSEEEGKSAEEQIRAFIRTPELYDNPVFADIRKALEVPEAIDGKPVGEKERESLLNSRIQDLARSIWVQGDSKELLHLRAKDGRYLYESDGSPKYSLPDSFLMTLSAAAGQRGPVANLSAGSLMHDKSERAERRSTERYVPSLPGKDDAPRHSPLLDKTRSSLPETRQAIQKAHGDSIASTIVRTEPEDRALSSKKGYLALDMTKVPGLTAERFLEAVRERLGKMRNRYDYEFFLPENSRVVAEKGGVAIIEFDPVKKVNKDSKKEYTVTMGVSGFMLDHISPEGGIGRAAASAAMKLGFHTAEGTAFFLPFTGGGSKVLAEYRNQGREREKARLAALEDMRKLREQREKDAAKTPERRERPRSSSALER